MTFSCSLQPNFAQLVIGSHTFIVSADDIEIERPTDPVSVVVVSPQIIPIEVTVGTVIAKFNLYSTDTLLATDTTLNSLKTFQRAQYAALLNGTNISYVSFNGFGINFTQGIIINCWGEGGIKISPTETLYDYLVVTIHTNKREWV